MRPRIICAGLLAVSLLLSLTACHRSHPERDDRTLERRPHTQTVTPPKRGEVFEP